MTKERKSSFMKTKDVVNISLFATLLSICAWICVPMTVPFTLQTFAVFLAMLVLGGKKGIYVILIYMFLGMTGVPVFAGGTAGIGVILGATGGYMIGWILLGLFVLLLEKTGKKDEKLQIITMAAGLCACYAFGTFWFVNIYAQESSYAAALGMCVAPFVIPDLVKMWLAFLVSKRVKKYMKNV